MGWTEHDKNCGHLYSRVDWQELYQRCVSFSFYDSSDVWIGIIERSCNDGQKTYYSDLDAAMRKYIAEHRTEFIPEGVDADAVDEEVQAEEAALSPTTPKDGGLQPSGPKPVAASRGLQWALDTFEAASKVATDSISGLFDIISDLLGGFSFSKTTVLSIIIALLVLSNVYTILTVGERREAGKRQVVERRETERERWVGDAVKAFMEVQQSINGPLTPSPTPTGVTTQSPVSPHSRTEGTAVVEELEKLRGLMERLEARVARLEQVD